MKMYELILRHLNSAFLSLILTNERGIERVFNSTNLHLFLHFSYIITPSRIHTMEVFYSHGQRPCKFIGTRESVYIEKNSTPTGSVWDTNMGIYMAHVTSCENVLLNYCVVHFYF